MAHLQILRPDHAAALLEFELTNRDYFARSISDRGDAYFRDFDDRLEHLLGEQERGLSAFHVLVDEEGEVVGRFNLYDIADGTAVVGYRVAERVARQGTATAALRELCSLARDAYGIRTLRAATSNANVASRRVLAKAGFVRTGTADVAGRDGAWYELRLVDALPREGADAQVVDDDT